VRLRRANRKTSSAKMKGKTSSTKLLDKTIWNPRPVIGLLSRPITGPSGSFLLVLGPTFSALLTVSALLTGAVGTAWCIRAGHASGACVNTGTCCVLYFVSYRYFKAYCIIIIAVLCSNKCKYTVRYVVPHVPPVRHVVRTVLYPYCSPTAAMSDSDVRIALYRHRHQDQE
jgi:hypothetical protein